MFKHQGQADLDAMQAMQVLMETPDDMQKWFDTKKQKFDALPSD